MSASHRPAVHFPSSRRSSDAIKNDLSAARLKDVKWRQGHAFSMVYFAEEEVYDVAKHAYTQYFSENGLNPTAFPSLRKFETETVSMVADLLNGPAEACGSWTSGGTESIFMAMHTARAWGEKHKPGITQPEVIVPITAHPAFDKAAHYLGIKLIHLPCAPDWRADVAATEAAITPNTVMLVGSAPQYCHGMVDPIEELGELAQRRNLLLHVDACVGGMILPFVEKLGRPVPLWDFRVPGVTSISCDLHKFGYTAKGASLILYRNRALRKHQFFVYTEWPGGIYASPSAGGTRPGGAIAAAWAVLNHLGEEGYKELAARTLDASDRYLEAIRQTDGLYIVADPVANIFGFASDKYDIFSIGDELALKGWHLDRQAQPPSLHLTVTASHGEVVERFTNDLRTAVEQTRKLSVHKLKDSGMKTIVKVASKILPEAWMSGLIKKGAGSSTPSTDGSPKRTAAMYGMMGSLPNRGDVHELVLDFLDKLTVAEHPAKGK